MTARNTTRNPGKGWFTRCMEGVKRSGSAEDPGAVCGAMLKRMGGERMNPTNTAFDSEKAAKMFARLLRAEGAKDVRVAKRSGKWTVTAPETRLNKSRFDKCVQSVEAEGGARDPQAVCAAEGRKKYGKAAFQRMTAAGKRNPLPLALIQSGEATVLTPYQKQATKAAQRFQKKIGLKLNRRKNPRNPADAASQVYEGFHGKPSEMWVEVVTPVHEHKYLSALGELISLDIISQTGARVTVRGFELDGEPALLCSNEKRNQMFFEGGDQSVDLKLFGIRDPIHESEKLGNLNSIEYYTIKKHLGKEGGEAIYRHKLKSHRFRDKPVVLYDTVNKLLSLAGGNYSVLDEGITD